MPFALLIIGAVLIITAFRGTYADLGAQLKSDFTGSGVTTGFLIWVAAIIAVGALGFAPVLRTPARMLLALIILAMVLTNQKNGNFFGKLTQALKTAPGSAPAVVDQPLTGSVPISAGGSAGSGALGTATQATQTAASAIPVFGALTTLV
jgi:hypothetical protein